MADVPARLKAARQALRADGPPPGRAWCEAWTAEVDAGVAELVEGAAHGGACTFVAVGGYGRRELCPASDVDLLVLHDRLEEPQLESIVRDVVYPLWDAGLKVGYAVRTRKQALEAIDDLDTATATIDGRVVAGLSSRYAAVRDDVLSRLTRKPRKLLDALTVADDDRRRRAGDAAEALEPDLKSGAGGLRDVQSLRWAAGALVGAVGLDPLVPARYLGAVDRGRLARAYDQLLATRVALHLEHDGASDVLRLDLQQGVAERLGYLDGDDDRDTAAHRLMTDHFLAARTVEHVHRRAWVLIAVDAQQGRRLRRPSQRTVHGFEVADGVVRLPPGVELDEPTLPLRLISALVETGGVLDRATATRVRRATQERTEPYPWTPALRERFLRLLWSGDAALPVLAELDDVGMLTALLPEWAALRGRAQRNPFHRFSLDRHLVHAAASLAELCRSRPWATAAMADVADRDGLMLGVLLHDVGKAWGEPHSETGIGPARAMAARTGVPEATVDLVGRLVEHHLLLPDVATRRDVADPAEARRVAELVGDRATLACLHLLSAADGTATGPTAWSSWKASLVASLVERVRAVFDERDPETTSDGAVSTAEDAVSLAPMLGVDEATVRSHLGQLPERYAAAVSPRAVVRHAGMAATRPEPGEVRTRVTPGEPAADGTAYDELDVVAMDTPGLFAKVAGVVALHGGSILQAHAHTRDDGTAVDTFTVVAPEHATASWWAQVEGDLVEAVAGRLAVRARVARKRAGEERRLARAPEIDTTVTTEPDPDGRATIVEVRTLDRIGVLYRIASALAELELDLVLAKVQTQGHEVIDVFYVRDATGRPLDDDHGHELDLAIRAALAE
ncbi:MAG: [protein-PII] uridylyltransferase [Actinomycetes bacterium]